jgi:glycosyltransferase involved in cell wall biosynthesis
MRILIVGGHDVGARRALASQLRSKGAEVHLAGFGHITPDPDIVGLRQVSPGGLSDLRQLVRSLKPDVVQVFDTKASLAVLLAIREVPVVRTVTGVGWSFSVEGFLGTILRLVYSSLQFTLARRADLTIFQNDEDQSLFVNHKWVRPSHATVIRGSGVDDKGLPVEEVDARRIRADLGIDAQTLLVVLPSRLLRVKGVQDLVDAAPIFADGRPNMKAMFAFAGDAERSRFRRASVESRSVGRVRISPLGHRTDLPAILTAADIVVLPTRYREGVPRVLIEAALCGTCVVATDAPGCRDVVIDHETGRLVRASDPRDLANTLMELSDSADLRAGLGSAARVHAQKNFLLDAIVLSYWEAYLSVCPNVSEQPAA